MKRVDVAALRQFIETYDEQDRWRTRLKALWGKLSDDDAQMLCAVMSELEDKILDNADALEAAYEELDRNLREYEAWAETNAEVTSANSTQAARIAALEAELEGAQEERERLRKFETALEKAHDQNTQTP